MTPDMKLHTRDGGGFVKEGKGNIIYVLFILGQN